MLRKFERILVGAALSGLAMAVPVGGAMAQVSQGLETFYAYRSQPIWFGAGATPAAQALPEILRRGQLDGFASGPQFASSVEYAIQTAASNPALVMAMDRVVSDAWVQYVQALEAPLPGFEYADDRRPAKVESATQIMNRAARNRDRLLDHVHKVAQVNQLYANLRDALWNESRGTAPSSAAMMSLARSRVLLPEGKSIIVDAATATLYMFEDGQVVDQMRVTVGKPETPTPLIASTIYYATFNPYWNVPANLAQDLIASKAAKQGPGYLKNHRYEVVTQFGPGGTSVAAGTIDWKAVASGKTQVFVRQLPGPLNSMGKMKFAFVNSGDIYLHDTPNKAQFGKDKRLLSNGCIRLADAPRLGRWLLEREPETSSKQADDHALLPNGVPIYLTYLTTRTEQGKTLSVADAYGWDRQEAPVLAAK